MTNPRDDHARATPHQPERTPLKPLQPASIRLSLILGIIGGLIAIIPAIVAWLK